MGTTATIILIVILVLVVIAVAAAVASSRRKRQREALKERFGPEYDRAVEADGGQRAAERRLKEVADQRDKLEIRALAPAERERYTGLWTSVQADFVDAPDQAVFRADKLVGQVMRDRGYPVDDFDSKIDMVAVDHPQIASDYRSAHEIAVRRKAGEAGTTEDLRQAFVHYRSLFGELLSDGRPHSVDDREIAERSALDSDDHPRDDRPRDDRSRADREYDDRSRDARVAAERSRADRELDERPAPDSFPDAEQAVGNREEPIIGNRRAPDGLDGATSVEGRHFATEGRHATDGHTHDDQVGNDQVRNDQVRHGQVDGDVDRTHEDSDLQGETPAATAARDHGDDGGYVEGAPIDLTEQERTRSDRDRR